MRLISQAIEVWILLEFILGKDFIRAIGLKIDFGTDPDNVLTIQNPPRSDTSAEIASILPTWDSDVDLVGQVFDLGAKI